MNRDVTFQGVWSALPTPFLPDGAVDWQKFEKLIAFQCGKGIRGVVVCGSTGEAATLSVQEKISLLRKAKALAGRDLAILGGCGGSSTQQTLELAKLMVDAGADGLLVVTPPYNKPSPEGLVAHFEAVAQGVSVPICLYHVPGRTAQLLSVATMQKLCSIPKIHAVKEATGDIAFFSRCVEASSEKVYLSGDDATYLASLAVGGKGVISVVSNVFPKEFVRIYDTFTSGDIQTAKAYHSALLEFTDVMFIESNPSPLKWILSKMDLCGPDLRLPLVSVRPESARTIEAVHLKTVGALQEIG